MPVTVHVVDSTIYLDTQRFRRLGSVESSDIVVMVGAMCNGNQQIVAEITQRVGFHQIGKLIFYGHAAPGIMNTSAGKSSGLAQNSGFGASCKPGQPCDEAQWQILRPYFANGGVVVLKGCNVAQGDAGRTLLLRLSAAFGVPVYGSDWYQATGVSYLVGHVFKASPDGAITQDKVNPGGGLWHLFRDDPVTAVAVGIAELFYDPR